MATGLDPTTTVRRAGHGVIGTFRGQRDGTNVPVLPTRDGSAPLPYGWEYTCGIGRHFPGGDGVRDSV
ncbi:hypothetical protein ABTY20_06300 [Streptomyces sp. NPDC126497]|uniref:hypothetical protein n=1 Tax=Streptomyces sp. NPDC126497 TaxID=3155313 RepID=UPI003316EFF4